MKRILFLLLVFPLWVSAQTVPGQLPNAPGDISRNPTTAPKKGGKILDDSTQNIYGPKTTRYFLEEDLFNNRKTLYQIDTGYVNFHRYDYQERNGRWYTDLGGINTALRPLFFEAPKQIGAQLGYDVYSPYGITPYQVKYYDTKSPFTQVYYVQGGNGQSILEFDLSRNVNSQWNVGMHVARNVSRRQIGLGSSSSQSDRQLASHWNFVIHTNYRTKNEKYAVLAHYNIFEHTIRDQGGLLTAGDPSKAKWDSLFLRINESSEMLPSSRSRERRNQLHVYQEYVPVKGFQVYHVGDFTGRFDRARDNAFATGYANGFYNNLANISKADPIKYIKNVPQADSVEATAYYWLLENKFGLKGSFKGFNYRVHVRRRDYSLSQWSRVRLTSTDTIRTTFIRTVPDTLGNPVQFTDTYTGYVTGRIVNVNQKLRRNENFLGAWVGYYFQDSTRLVAEGEYLIGADYRLHADYYGKWFRASFTSTLNSPTLIQERFLSPILKWDENLSNVFTNQVQASAPLKFNNLFIEPSIHYSLTKNHIYFDTASVARQAGSAISVYRAGINLSWKYGKFSTSHQAYFTTTSGPDLIRMPRILTQSRVALDFVYSKVMFVQVGVDAHYRAGYYADFYQPISQQFYLNDKYKVPGYVQLDAFADIRINRVRLTVQMRNFAEGIVPKVFFPTPYFPGLKRSFSFGVIWPLFD
ncbi:putative porin [Siphonobacter aquaeclarae]|uniref:Putative porin n=1 Tax=Siphonobacter aquaeclarae TaxID=563176 RepID=A0A1G9RGC8_9BACT|nr:putative porin [Siphonobacter aquaeclarae]SDM21495.1 Putative porin [Siphonobacter aquaeclarae]